MSIHPSKCSLIKMHKSSKQPSQCRYQIENTYIKPVESCRYLGLYIDNKLNIQNHINKITSKLNQNPYHLYFIKKSGLKLLPKTVLQIYKARSRPMIEYASIFYFQKDTQNKINTLQNNYARSAYPCKKSTPIQVLQMIANIEPIHIRVQKLTLRHWFRAKYQFHNHQTSYHSINTLTF